MSAMVSKLEKEMLVLKAAEEVFTRYGYARTTMGDIAATSGMSRPSLYLLFPDKDAIFARVIEEMDLRVHREIEAVLAELDSLQEKLMHACLRWGLHGVELAAAHPDAGDLFDLRFSAVRKVYDRFQLLLVGILGEACETSGMKVTAAELARAMTYGLRGLRYAAASLDDMTRLIEVHVSAYVGGLRKMSNVSDLS